MPNGEKELCFNYVLSLQLANTVIPFKVANWGCRTHKKHNSKRAGWVISSFPAFSFLREQFLNYKGYRDSIRMVGLQLVIF